MVCGQAADAMLDNVRALQSYASTSSGDAVLQVMLPRSKRPARVCRLAAMLPSELYCTAILPNGSLFFTLRAVGRSSAASIGAGPERKTRRLHCGRHCDLCRVCMLACAHSLTPSACLGLPCAVGVAWVHGRIRHTTPSTCGPTSAAVACERAPWCAMVESTFCSPMRGCVAWTQLPQGQVHSQAAHQRQGQVKEGYVRTKRRGLVGPSRARTTLTWAPCAFTRFPTLIPPQRCKRFCGRSDWTPATRSSSSTRAPSPASPP